MMRPEALDLGEGRASVWITGALVAQLTRPWPSGARLHLALCEADVETGELDGAAGSTRLRSDSCHRGASVRSMSKVSWLGQAVVSEVWVRMGA